MFYPSTSRDVSFHLSDKNILSIDLSLSVFYLFHISLISLSLLAMFYPEKSLCQSLPTKKDSQKIATLGLSNQSKQMVTQEEVSYLSNLIRQASARLPQDHFSVITQENIRLMLPPDRTLEDCIKDCQISTGRAIGADYIITGEVFKFGQSIHITLQLYESKTGILKSTDQVSGDQLDTLEKPLQIATLGLFIIIEPEISKIVERWKKGFVYEKISLNDLNIHHVNQTIPVFNQLEVKGIDFGQINVDLLENYQKTIDYDQDAQLTADEKKKRWDELWTTDPNGEIGKFAKKRSNEWQNWIDQETNQKIYLEKIWQDMVKLDEKRKQKRDEDWHKLSRLLKLKLIAEEDKKKWVEAFIEAYGVHEQLNPYFKAIDEKFLVDMENQIMNLEKENLAEIKQKLDFIKSFPSDFLKLKGVSQSDTAYTDHDQTNHQPQNLHLTKVSRQPNQSSLDDLKIQWIYIKGGSFMMGSMHDDDESPIHHVHVNDFYMSKTEVTVQQYRICVNAGICSIPDQKTAINVCNWNDQNRENHPINCINWNQARTFAKWVGGDLPSEAQWEYAARSKGQDIQYAWGNTNASCKYAVMSDEIAGCGRRETWEVCSKFGQKEQELCDMNGNVWEWILDEWHSSYDLAPNDDHGWCTQNECDHNVGKRVSRGGAWNSDSSVLRNTNRYGGDATNRNDVLGFRVSKR